MESQYWHKKWQENDIAFHQKDFNPLLVRYFNKLESAQGSRVFVPLCGKTNDITWLMSQGHQVVGVEFSEMAVAQLFDSLGVTPTITRKSELVSYSARNIEVFVGDYFLLNTAALGKVDAIYDRAALVALPYEMRVKYTTHLISITHQAPQLVITFEYDQNSQPGPPFSITKQELENHYHKDYSISLQESVAVAGGLKGRCAAQEQVWILS